MVKFTAGGALVLGLSFFFTSALEAHFKVRVRNLTYQQPFSPPAIVAHTRDVSVFKEGFPASDALKVMAEDGDNSALIELGNADDIYPFLCGAAIAEGPLSPGGTWTADMTVSVDICPDPVFSVVGMLVNTNDAFVGIDSNGLNLEGSVKVYPPAFDAGTEVNNELCSHIPGPACPADSGNLEDGPGEGFIHIHRGFHGLNEDEGGLTAVGYDWRNPVAEVYVARMHEE